MAEIQTYLYGKKFPNRIFVGGLPVNTTAQELAGFFQSFGHVTESKIILDDSGVSKGYGFVTFNDVSAVKLVESVGIIYFKNKKVNIGPAVKKECPTVEPELVALPQQCQTVSPVILTNTIPAYYPVGYHQQPQQPMQPFVATDCYGYYQVTNDGVYWLTYPNVTTVMNQNNQPYCPTHSSSDEEVKIKRSKKKELPPRFMRK